MAGVGQAIPHHKGHLLHLQIQLHEVQQRHVDILAISIRLRQRYQRNRRRWWVKPWIERRMLFGQYHTLMTELQRECNGDFDIMIYIM